MIPRIESDRIFLIAQRARERPGGGSVSFARQDSHHLLVSRIAAPELAEYSSYIPEARWSFKHADRGVLSHTET